MGEVLASVAAIVLAILFAAAAWHKLARQALFRATLADYDLLPDALIRPAALALPVLEASIAVLWATSTALPAATGLTLGLLSVYCVAVGRNLARGRVHISCGCGIGAEQPLSMGIIVRNGLLGVLSLSGLLAIQAREFAWFEYAVVAMAAASIGLALLASSVLMNNDLRMAGWAQRD